MACIIFSSSSLSPVAFSFDPFTKGVIIAGVMIVFASSNSYFSFLTISWDGFGWVI